MRFLDMLNISEPNEEEQRAFPPKSTEPGHGEERQKRQESEKG